LHKVDPKGNVIRNISIESATSSAFAQQVGPEFHLRPGEKLTQIFTKQNPVGWFRYFEALYSRNNLVCDVKKIDALIPTLTLKYFFHCNHY